MININSREISSVSRYSKISETNKYISFSTRIFNLSNKLFFFYLVTYVFYLIIHLLSIYFPRVCRNCHFFVTSVIVVTELRVVELKFQRVVTNHHSQPLALITGSRTITSDRTVYNNSSLSFSSVLVGTTSLDRNYLE